jgi:hypothetical protein
MGKEIQSEITPTPGNMAGTSAQGAPIMMAPYISGNAKSSRLRCNQGHLPWGGGSRFGRMLPQPQLVFRRRMRGRGLRLLYLFFQLIFLGLECRDLSS